MPHRPREGDGEGNVAEHVRFERELRGWSTAELARYVTEAGCPMSQSAIWRIESGEPRRKISVDELIAFARVFEKSIDDLLQPPTTEYPEDLVREYVEMWLDAEMVVWHGKVDASVAFGDVAKLATAYPGVASKLSDLVAEVMEEGHRSVLTRQVRAALKELPAYVSANQSRTLHMAQVEPLINYWRRIGLTDGEMIREAERLRIEGTLRGTLRSEVEMGSALEFLKERSSDLGE
ncbi:helix-turn-helix transcriptional regulator [Streptomyces fradiae]|uniref:helix-turn-helix domain-containing protein n=1 Tax=Streptomyces fradiae TaxID=1906 RepID=UPI0034007F96